MESVAEINGWHDREIRAAARAVRNGATYAAAAKAHGVTWSALKAYCRRRDIVRPATAEFAFVYGLVCPISGQIVYVGAAANPWKRLAQHWLTPSSELLAEWIATLKAGGLRPTVKVLAKTFTVDVAALEQEWIRKMLRRGLPLLNKEAREC